MGSKDPAPMGRGLFLRLFPSWKWTQKLGMLLLVIKSWQFEANCREVFRLPEPMAVVCVGNSSLRG